MTIHELLMCAIKDALQKKLIDDLQDSDVAKAGVVMLGSLQGDPDPDTARISVMVYENDPDNFFRGAPTALTGPWIDEISEVEVGGPEGGGTWDRRFTVKARVLLVNTAEALDAARSIASTVKNRIERTLLGIDLTGITDGSESVTRGILSANMKSEMVQSGGPSSYDFFIKVRCDVQTSLAIGG